MLMHIRTLSKRLNLALLIPVYFVAVSVQIEVNFDGTVDSALKLRLIQSGHTITYCTLAD